MNEEIINMDNWKRIWKNRQLNIELLQQNDDFEKKFMELKRLTGNDTLGKNGVSFESFMNQYTHMVQDLSYYGKNVLKSVFEVGCGSAPYLMKFQTDGIAVGGMDYSEELIQAAKIVLYSPIELYCDEAINLDTSHKYDTVFSTSAFEYFRDMDYATEVMEKMWDKAVFSIGIIDVHDYQKKNDYIEYRRSVIENYDELYKGLDKLFYKRSFFEDYATNKGAKIVIKDSYLDGYWNKPFVYDVYIYK